MSKTIFDTGRQAYKGWFGPHPPNMPGKEYFKARRKRREEELLFGGRPSTEPGTRIPVDVKCGQSIQDAFREQYPGLAAQEREKMQNQRDEDMEQHKEFERDERQRNLAGLKKRWSVDVKLSEYGKKMIAEAVREGDEAAAFMGVGRVPTTKSICQFFNMGVPDNLVRRTYRHALHQRAGT